MKAALTTESAAKRLLKDLLSAADISINGGRPWDLTVRDDRAYDRILRYRNLGMGESYMDGWVDCPRWDEFAARVLRSPLEKALRNNWRLALQLARGAIVNLGSKRRAFDVGVRHYDIGNDLYEKMLDKRMIYTCAYWKDARTLDEAQEAKLDLVCRKIGIGPGMRVLDIGCGWGGFARFAAERYGAEVVGITISRAQAELAGATCRGLPVEILLEDYRDIGGTFDRVVSLGMFEHVFYKNYRTFMKVAHRRLASDGLMLLHTIGGNVSARATDPWIEKYIFPNSLLPSVAQIAAAAEGLFVMEDWHNFGADYDKTLLAWHANTESHWPSLKDKYGERFHRMWTYYLLTCAGTFRARTNQLWQIVLSKQGVGGGYLSIR